MQQKIIACIGGGAANLMAATRLSQTHQVHIYEQGRLLGRKFLVAGKGGFNLTNAAQKAPLEQYYQGPDFFKKILQAQHQNKMRTWLADLGIPTFVGSSGRVFPEQGIKPAEVLKAIKNRLVTQGVQFHFHHKFVGFDAQKRPIIQHQGEQQSIQADTYIFALGGASWPKTGANQAWLEAFETIGTPTRSFEASNCGICLAWEPNFLNSHAGQPLKNIALHTGENPPKQYQKGEAVISQYGLEGNAVYPMSPCVRQQLHQTATAKLYLDLKPHNSLAQLLAKTTHKKTGKAILPKHYLQAFKLNKTSLALAKQLTNKASYLNPQLFAAQLKALPLEISALRPIEEAISTVGGLAWEAVDEHFALHTAPHCFAIGEMLDWDAPTGGFLLQGCFAMAWALGDWLDTTTP